MDWSALWQALGLVFVIEGVLPFLSPRRFRQVYVEALKLDDRQLRVLALVSMIGGLGLLALAH